MPVFYLHIHNGSGFSPDEEGQEMASLDKAREVAVRGARSLLSAEVDEGRLDLRGRIEIADAHGRRVAVVPFREAVRIIDGELPPDEDGGSP